MKKENAKAAADAMVNLNTFAAVVAILEGGCIRGGGAQKDAQEIIELCQEFQGVQLSLYDRAMR